MGRIAIAIAICALLEPISAGYALGNAVRDPQAAISIGRERCFRFWPKWGTAPVQNGWTADDLGDYWLVWLGVESDGHHFMETIVTKRDGTTSRCLDWVVTKSKL